MKVCIVVGTRPEIIKMSPLIRYLERSNLDYFILHTGQHYSHNLDGLFFEELELPAPRYNLGVGSGPHGKQTGIMLEKIEEILIKEEPSIVLVQGDTNSVLAGALAAAKLHIKVGHVEAGLRSYNREMPEEINRVLTDHVSDFLFCPTEDAKSIALKEGINSEKIHVSGNTIVDAVVHSLKLAEQKSRILETLNVKPKGYLLVTMHRPENVDLKERLKAALEGFEQVHKAYDLPLILPIHPRTKKQISVFDLKIPEGLVVIEPVGFLDFLQLEANAKLILTDSGGVQEEACILRVPCVTLREDTERPETVEVGANILAGTERIMECTKEMIDKERNWKNPFGDGTTGERIIKIIQNAIQE